MKEFIVGVAWLSLQYFVTALATLPVAIVYANMHINGTNTEGWDMFLFGCSMLSMAFGWSAFNRIRLGKWSFK